MGYKRAKERNRRLARLGEETRHSYGAGAWFDEEKGRYIRYSYNSKPSKIRCRRATRRRLNELNEEVIPRGNHYRRYYDYWWEIL